MRELSEDPIEMVSGVSDISIRVAKEKSTIIYCAVQLDNIIQKDVDLLVSESPRIKCMQKNVHERKQNRLGASNRSKVIPDWSTELYGERSRAETQNIAAMADQAAQMNCTSEICDVGMTIAWEEPVSSATPKARHSALK